MIWTAQQEHALSEVRKWLGQSEQKVFRLFGFAGTGKAQPLDVNIQTPTGPVKMGSIKVGNKILGIDGKSVTVIGVFPQGVKPVYRVTFRDGTSTRCCGDHLWTVTNGRDKTKGIPPRTLSTTQIHETGVRFPSGDYRWRIPLTKPVEYQISSPAFDPYTVGVLIGDGHLSGSSMDIASPDMEIVERVRASLPEGMTLSTKCYGACPHHFIHDVANPRRNRLRSHLQEVGLAVLSLDKFIPTQYLVAPINDRIALLRGLMDTDGHASLGNRISYSTGSLRLADDIMTLVQSLGGTAIKRWGKRADSPNIEYTVNIKVAFCPFHLKRKADRWRASSKNPPSRFITKIEPIGEAEQQCIVVDAEDGLYLTDSFIATHNSTIAKEVSEMVGGSIKYAAFTGKAASVMRRKGCAGASTIHSLIYIFKELDFGQPVFVLNDDSEVKHVKLVVIDEVSMVGEEMGRDLLSFGTKILVIGDPAQLPPVKGTGFFTSQEPDVLLTEVHRQAAENPIIALSMIVRNGGRLSVGDYGETRIIARKDVNSEIVLASDQVIVGLNRSRESYNARIRTLLGRVTSTPVIDDKLICLKNDRELGVFNGTMWTVKSVEENRNLFDMGIASLDEDSNTEKKISVLGNFFDGTSGELHWKQKSRTQEFTFGFAITAHKGQGSQWNNITVFDESGVFRDDARAWLYTAVTRAAEKLTLVI